MKYKFIFTAINIILFGSQIIFAQYPNIRVSDPFSTTPEEVTIAINPVNPQNLAAGANIRFYYYSMDGGKTWTEGNMSSSYGVWGDPCVTFDAEGNLYFGHLSNPPGPPWIDRIVVQKSTDGGLNWNGGVGVGYVPSKNQDKEWLIADHTNSPFRNNIYMAWTEFDDYGSYFPLDSSRIRFSRSTDSGTSWSNPVVISDLSGDCIDSDNTVEGAVPAVGPNGEVYTSWSGPLGIMFDRSFDGGQTFGKDIFVTDQPGGWNFNVSGISRCNGFPITLCDISDLAFGGTIYIIWSDQRNGIGDTDVFLIKSTDKGDTWSDLIRVNDDENKRQQFFPWAAIDQTTGNIYVAFYDRRETSGNKTDVFLARSIDGGETFENFKISESSFTPNSGVFFGDYINIAALNGKVYPIWTRMDGSVLSVWTAIIDETTSVKDQLNENLPSTFSLQQNYPNPFNSSTQIRFQLTEPANVLLEVYNVSGQLMNVLLDENKNEGEHSIDWNALKLNSGIYLIQLKTDRFTQMKKCLLVK